MDVEEQASALRDALVEQLKERGSLNSPEVEAAFRAVPRHLFLPGLADDLEKVYSDEAIATKFEGEMAVSSSSQPAMMAIMLEQLGLRPGDHVLEIGAGTGYNAALMAYLVGEGGRVTAVDIDEDIVAQARQNLDAAGYGQVQVVQGDGGYGYAEGAPYDRIVLTVGAADVLPAWVEQLKPAGRLLLPLSLNGPQKSVAFRRAGDYLESDSIYDCGFMRLRGAFAGPERQLWLGEEGGVFLASEGAVAAEAETIYRWLQETPDVQPTAVQVALADVWRGLNLWLALREPRLCDLTALGEQVGRGLVPCLFSFGGNGKMCFTIGLIDREGLAVLGRPPRDKQPVENNGDRFELWIWGYGRDETLAEQLRQEVEAWEAAERPGTAGLRIRAYPADTRYEAAEGEVVVRKRWSQLVVDWRLEIGD
jgi:protein-L-isoaspartate(D-aspartate) O-methyltransferase